MFSMCNSDGRFVMYGGTTRVMLMSNRSMNHDNCSSMQEHYEHSFWD